jgi:hypothetical protein
MRRAFVMGSNGPADLSPLRFACDDATRITACLSTPQCGFEVVNPEPGADTSDVRHGIYSLADACTADDTLLCYFSGHGVLEKGSLFLLWDSTRRDRLLSTALAASDVMQALKHCKAHSKLLILDCCHAGAVVNMTGLKDGSETRIEDTEIQPENHLVLMASDRLEKAREIEELRGSFLTTHICTALSERINEADQDRDNRISIEDLEKWLSQQARRHNVRFPDRTVPVPYTFGQRRGEFFLARNPNPAAGPEPLPPPDPPVVNDNDQFVYDAFVSYHDAEPDRAWVRTILLPRLTEAGLRVCDHRDFRLGWPRVTEIARSVELSRYTLAVLTPRYPESSFTELADILAEHLGLETAAQRLITINRRQSVSEYIEPRLGLRARVALDMTDDNEFDDHLERLIAGLRQPVPDT